MTTAFPTSIDAFTNPIAADPLDSATVPHASQHANINDAVEAIETQIGTTAAPVLARLAGPQFTGVPTAPTAAPLTNTTQIATTAFVISAANTGPQGSQGVTGAQGSQGATGSQGSQGATGAAATPGFVTGYYYNSPSAVTTLTQVLSRTFYSPIMINETMTVDRLAVMSSNLWSGTATVRFGLYNTSGGKPTTVKIDAGTVSVTAASTVYEITVSLTLAPGVYWMALNAQAMSGSNNNMIGRGPLVGNGYLINTNGTFTADAGCWIEDSITGAFATAGTLTNATNGAQVALRKA